jgi:hypothetical protein
MACEINIIHRARDRTEWIAALDPLVSGLVIALIPLCERLGCWCQCSRRLL